MGRLILFPFIFLKKNVIIYYKVNEKQVIKMTKERAIKVLEERIAINDNLIDKEEMSDFDLFIKEENDAMKVALAALKVSTAALAVASAAMEGVE